MIPAFLKWEKEKVTMASLETTLKFCLKILGEALGFKSVSVKRSNLLGMF